MSLIYPGSQQETLDLLAKATAKLAEKREKAKYEGSLIEFANYVWPVVEPAIPMVRGWVMEAICEHLEAVTHGYIRRLLINVPPGFSKSLLTDVFWPAWEWGPMNLPHLRYVCASYSNHLTERDNMRCRNIVISDRYQKLWGDRFGISNEQFTKVKFANDKTGWKLATSVGGIGVGERGDRFIIDDANNTMEMESEVTRASTNMWFTEVVPDRLNNQQKSAIVIIQQRLHEEDVSGVALSRDMGYVHLCIPMEYVPITQVSGFTLVDGKKEIKTFIDEEAESLDDDDLFWVDPRIEDNELAWPERFPARVVEELKRDKGPYAYAGQYMQSPQIRGGSIIRYEYWQDWTGPWPDNIEYVIASLDTAYTAKQENDASALTTWGVFRDQSGNPQLMMLAAWAERLEFHDLVTKVIDSCTRDRRPVDNSDGRWPVDRLLIEDKAAGHSVAQELHRMIGFSGNFGIELVNPQRQGDKVARVYAVQHLFADKMVYAPVMAGGEYGWVRAVKDQCAAFPKGSHDDLVDSTSMALRYLRDVGWALRKEESALDMDAKVAYRSRMSALYPC